MTGDEHLHEQLEQLTDSLRAFDDPFIDEVPGLRWMRDALQERKNHIESTIRGIETCSIELTLVDAAPHGDGVRLDFLLGLLGPVQDAVRAAGTAHVAGFATPPSKGDLATAFDLYVGEVSVDDDVTVELTRRPAEVATQLVDPDSGAPIVEHAGARVTQIVCAFAEGDADVPDELRRPLGAFAAALVAAPVVLRWSWQPFKLDEAECNLDRAAAQRLARACQTD